MGNFTMSDTERKNGKIFLVVCFALLKSTSAAFCADTVHIDDQFTGCFTHYSENATFIRSGDEYKSHLRVLDAGRVEAAKNAALATAGKIEIISPAFFGITEKQIKLHQAEALDAASQFANSDAHLPKSLTYDDVHRAVKTAILFGATGNSTNKPALKVVFVGSPDLVVSTDHDMPTMLPWKVQMGDKHWETYSPDVPRTISMLLSKSSPNFSAASYSEYWSHGFWTDMAVWGLTFERESKSGKNMGHSTHAPSKKSKS